MVLAQRQIFSQHIDDRPSEQAVPRTECLRLQHGLDFLLYLRPIALQVLRPFTGNAINLVFCVLQRDVRILTGPGCGDIIPGMSANCASGCSCRHISKEGALNVGAGLHRRDLGYEAPHCK